MWINQQPLAILQLLQWSLCCEMSGLQSLCMHVRLHVTKVT